MKAPILPVLIAMALPASAAVIQFDLEGIGGAGLLTTNELGMITTTGSGGEMGAGITYDDVSKVLSVNVGWGSGNGFADLTGSATSSHIHGPALINQAAGVLFSLPRVDSTASNGSISTTIPALTTTQEAQLFGGQFYINIHTVANGGGEIRGNLFAVPEPSGFLLGAIGLFGVLRRRR